MIPTILFFLPATVCLFWVLIHFLMASRTNTFHITVGLLLVSGISLFADACYNAKAPMVILDWTFLFSQLFGPSMIPLLILYFRHLDSGYGRMSHKYQHLWIVLPVALFTGALVLHSLAGSEGIRESMQRIMTDGLVILPEFRESVAGMYCVWVYVTAVMVVLAEILVLVVFFVMTIIRKRFSPINLIRFLRGKKISLQELQISITVFLLLLFALELVFSRDYIHVGPWGIPLLMVAISATLFAFAFLALFGDKQTLTLREMLGAFRYNYNERNKSRIVEEMINDFVDDAEDEAIGRIREKLGFKTSEINKWKKGELPEADASNVARSIFSAVADSWDENSLMARFQQLMKEEQLFLQPQLTLQDVADRLHSNKTYISKLVNNTYNLGFPELINTLRVDYAEQYILSHRGVKQTQVAAECGFLSASSFNTIFKKVTGMTPKVWIASMESQKKQ